MAFNVNVFRASLQFDGARSSLFDIIMTFPTAVATGGAAAGVAGSAAQQVTFKARASSLPGDSLSSLTVNYFGREIKVAGTRTFPEWSFTVINDEDFIIRNTFERWMSGINSHVGNLRQSNLISAFEYQTDAIIRQYSKSDPLIPIKQYKIVGAFPTDVSAIDVDWSNDAIEEFQVTFAYQWWESPLTTDAATAVSGLQVS
jgi:hypothetical protein